MTECERCELSERFAALSERLDEHIRESREHRARVDRVLMGNGAPGLVRLVDRLEQAEARRAEHDRSLAKIIGALIVAAILSAGSAFFALVAAHADAVSAGLGR